MAYVDAEYIQKYDSGDILVWPCVVDTGYDRFYRIDEFYPQAEGKPFDEIPDWAMLEEEWVEWGGGKMWYALKDSEYNDYYMDSKAEGDAIIEEQFGDEIVVLFDDDEIPV